MPDKRNIIKELIDYGKSKGSLTNKEIMDMLDDVDIDVEQIDKMYESFEENGIEIIDDLPIDDVLDLDVDKVASTARKQLIMQRNSGGFG